MRVLVLQYIYINVKNTLHYLRILKLYFFHHIFTTMSTLLCSCKDFDLTELFVTRLNLFAERGELRNKLNKLHVWTCHCHCHPRTFLIYNTFPDVTYVSIYILLPMWSIIIHLHAVNDKRNNKEKLNSSQYQLLMEFSMTILLHYSYICWRSGRVHQLNIMKLSSDLTFVIRLSKYIYTRLLSVGKFPSVRKRFLPTYYWLHVIRKFFYFLLTHANGRKIKQKKIIFFTFVTSAKIVFWSSVRVSQTMNEKKSFCIIFTNTSGKAGKGRLMHVLTQNEAKIMKNKRLFFVYNYNVVP